MVRKDNAWPRNFTTVQRFESTQRRRCVLAVVNSTRAHVVSPRNRHDEHAELARRHDVKALARLPAPRFLQQIPVLLPALFDRGGHSLLGDAVPKRSFPSGNVQRSHKLAGADRDVFTLSADLLSSSSTDRTSRCVVHHGTWRPVLQFRRSPPINTSHERDSSRDTNAARRRLPTLLLRDRDRGGRRDATILRTSSQQCAPRRNHLWSGPGVAGVHVLAPTAHRTEWSATHRGTHDLQSLTRDGSPGPPARRTRSKALPLRREDLTAHRWTHRLRGR